MKKVALLIASLTLFGAAQAQATTPTPAPVQGIPANAPRGIPANAPVAQPQVHIAIADFTCPNYSRCNGRNLSDALANVLVQSGYFALYERADLKAALDEDFILSDGDVGSQIQGADLLIKGSISTIGEDASGGNACFLGVCLGQKEERVVAHLKIFDVRSSRIIATTQIEGRSSATSAGLNIGGFSLGGNQSSGVDKAISDMLSQAVNKLTGTIPANYYR